MAVDNSQLFMAYVQQGLEMADLENDIAGMREVLGIIAARTGGVLILSRDELTNMRMVEEIESSEELFSRETILRFKYK